jgi:hypothetical protein
MLNAGTSHGLDSGPKTKTGLKRRNATHEQFMRHANLLPGV